MNYLELQQRANLLVEKVNQYEANLEGTNIDETETLNQHIYADLYCLRPVLKMLFGSTVEERTNRTLENDIALRVFATSAPMWNSSFNLLSYNKGTERFNCTLGSNVLNLTTNDLKNFKASEIPINPLKDQQTLSDYLYVPVLLKVTTGDDITTEQAIAVTIYQSTKLSILLREGRIDGVLNSNVCTMISNAQPNTTYYLKWDCNSNRVYFYTGESINGPWTEIDDFGGHAYASPLYLGISSNNTAPFFGTIDLIESQAAYGASNRNPAPLVNLTNGRIRGYTYPSTKPALCLNNIFSSSLHYSDDLTTVQVPNSVLFNYSESQKPTSSDDILRLTSVIKLVEGRRDSAYNGFDDLGSFQWSSSNQVKFGMYPTYTSNFNGTQVGDAFKVVYEFSKNSTNYSVLMTVTRLRDNLTKSITTTQDSIPIPYTSGYGELGSSGTTKSFPGMIIPNINDCYFEVYKASQEIGFESDQHEFMNNIDMYNQYNMIQLDAYQNTIQDRDSRITQGLNYSYSANIQDALVTESQIANLFKWNTTSSETILNNTRTLNRQVPGIVLYYLGTDYDGTYTATIPYNPQESTINAVNYATPSYYGAFYVSDDVTTSQVGPAMGHEACRIFMPGMNYTRGVLESPQQIWQPDRLVGESNTGFGFNWQGSAIYHELVFKRRRNGSTSNSLDFIPAIDADQDNDPQGLAMRTAIAQQKNFYKNRPWFTELDELFNANTKQLAENIISKQNTITVTDPGSLNTELLELIGDVSVSEDGIASNFSSNNWIKFKTVFNPTSTYKIIIKANGSEPTQANYCLLFGVKDVYSFVVGLSSSNRYALYFSTNGSSWNIENGSSVSTTVSPVGDTYWKLEYDGTNTVFSTSKDNVTYTPVKTISGKIFTNNSCYLYISGSRSSTDNPFDGTVDLKSSFIQIGNDDPQYLFTQNSTHTETVDYTDETFFESYKLDYDTWQTSLGLDY